MTNSAESKNERQIAVYLHKGEWPWDDFARDYRDVNGADPTPDQYGGFWFRRPGEPVRLGRQRNAR